MVSEKDIRAIQESIERAQQNKYRLIELPSGLKVAINKKSLMDFLASGSVPTPLLSFAMEFVDKGAEMLRAAGSNSNAFVRIREFGECVIKNIVVYPKIVDHRTSNESGDEIEVEEITFIDLLHLISEVSGVKDMAPFLKKQKGVHAS